MSQMHMNSMSFLVPEWERIDILGACLSAARRGEEIPQEIGERLGVVQQEVTSIRQEEPWRSIVSEFGFETMDMDILACSLAPEAEPRLGWMYQELQSGIDSPYPTPALIRELFVMNSEESFMINQRLKHAAPLYRSGMIESHSTDLFKPIVPTSRARSSILGWPVENTFNTESVMTPGVMSSGSTTSGLIIPGALEVPVSATWNDIVLPSRCIKNLREYILWVTHRKQVEVDWGGRVTGGPVALFSGPSGTGKTFASEVVAHELGWPLYRVDLGLLVSKYIGETEKNLNALFDAAHGKSVVLLFDEADSLFSKRGEVKEARDRYANMEVSHLLSRIERHRGPCIMTSNLRQHIDTAFTRRFQIVIDFPRPDAIARTKLWHMHIPPKAPLDSEVDYQLLGNEFKLSGGQIRNAALHAAFLAAGESSPINLKHIVSAVWIEFAKKGGELSAASLGSLASYLPTEAKSGVNHD